MNDSFCNLPKKVKKENIQTNTNKAIACFPFSCTVEKIRIEFKFN